LEEGLFVVFDALQDNLDFFFADGFRQIDHIA
jgi:hypothetical protein